ncbi:MAG: prolyl oligopeptidase family serine peptidase [Lachnospiraceae bacterium]|nr:prolyl oligopeptidase family serine peptidase [Lachnospiraceae bacterium]
MIVVSPQVEDWNDRSARQTIELTEYFLENYAVDESRVYGAGYSAGGETMSRVMGMRPELFAAYLHGASQWDGEYAPVAESGTAVYIFMAEHDEYYGSGKAQEAYAGLLAAYRQMGMDAEEIGERLMLWIPEDKYFNDKGITNYHGGGNMIFEEAPVRQWLLSQSRT